MHLKIGRFVLRKVRLVVFVAREPNFKDGVLSAWDNDDFYIMNKILFIIKIHVFLCIRSMK